MYAESAKKTRRKKKEINEAQTWPRGNFQTVSPVQTSSASQTLTSILEAGHGSTMKLRKKTGWKKERDKRAASMTSSATLKPQAQIKSQAQANSSP